LLLDAVEFPVANNLLAAQASAATPLTLDVPKQNLKYLMGMGRA